MKFSLCALSLVVSLAGQSASAEMALTPDLRDDLAAFNMTAEDLAFWMQGVLEGRGHACSEVLTMGGKVPRVDTEDRRNVATSVGCAENSYFITVGIDIGWKIHP